jgi:site-specific recombinase XerD
MEKNLNLENLLEEWTSQPTGPTSRKSKYTLQQYATDVRQIVYQENFTDYQELAKRLTERYDSITEWSEDRIRTIKRRASALNAFTTFLKKTGKISQTLKYSCKLSIDTPIRAMPESDFQKIISQIHSRNYSGARDRAIMLLIYYTGIKPKEIVKLKNENFKTGENGEIYLEVGEYKKRKFSLNEEILGAINKYKQLYEEAAKPHGFVSLQQGYFLRNKDGAGLSTRSIRRKFGGYAKKAGIKYGITSLRYSYAKRQIEQGIDKKELAKLLGVSRPYAWKIVKGLV